MFLKISMSDNLKSFCRADKRDVITFIKEPFKLDFWATAII